MEQLKVIGVLPIGVIENGRLCNVVSLREMTLRDSLRTATPPEGVSESEFYPKLAGIAACLTIDGVPQDKITHDFILDLPEEDGEYLLNLKQQLSAKKKEQVQTAATLTP